MLLQLEDGAEAESILFSSTWLTGVYSTWLTGVYSTWLTGVSSTWLSITQCGQWRHLFHH